jgi:hypothetical protein
MLPLLLQPTPQVWIQLLTVNTSSLDTSAHNPHLKFGVLGARDIRPVQNIVREHNLRADYAVNLQIRGQLFSKAGAQYDSVIFKSSVNFHL